MSGRLSALCLSLLLLFLAACNQAAPPATTAPPEAAAPQLEPAVPQLEPQATTSRTFSSTGAEQTFVVPAGITSVTVVARGAPGGTSGVAGAGGRGAVVTAELTVTPGQTLYLNVGGASVNSGCYPDATCIGGFNGGGSNSLYGGGGGGASDVRTVSRSETGSLSSRLLVAAGGGGGGYSDICNGPRLQGGTGGDADSAGGNGAACEGTPGGTGGGAGTASAGGAGGSPEGASGSLGQGGNGGGNYGGGGGGGLYGGGGGGRYGVSPDYSTYSSAGGGGGGSSLDPDGGSITLDSSRTPQITISYTKQSQTISFTSTAPTDAKVGGSYTPTATATSGLSVTFGTSTPEVCTFSDGTVSFIATGECIVTADQAGDESYAAAPQATQSFTVKQDQTISFTSTAPTDAKVGGSYTPTATATSGLTVTFGTSTPEVCTFSSGTVSFVAAGECTVTADQAGDESYAAAPQATQSFTIAPLKQDQTASFTSTVPSSATVGGSYTPTATATSGLSVTFGTSTPTTCTFSSGTVSFIAAGTCTVTADQAGDATYNPATQVTQSFTVSLPPVVADPYTIDFETAPANRLLYSVKVGQGVVYNGQGSASSASVPVVGKRANNGKILEAQVARVVNLYGSKRLIIGSSASSNTPAPTGGRVKLTFTNYDPAGAKLTSMTLSNLTKRGAYLTFYYANGSSSRQNLGTTSAGGSLVVPLAVEKLRAVDVYAPNAYAVDDVKFEVAPKR